MHQIHHHHIGNGTQQRDHEYDAEGIFVPPQKDVGGRLPDADDQRQVGDLAIDEQAPATVGNGSGIESAVAFARQFLEQLGAPQILSNKVAGLRPAHQRDAIAAQQCDAAVRTKRYFLEHVLEIRKPQACDDDAAERTVGFCDAAAQADHTVAAHAREYRTADIEPDVRVVLVRQEIIAVRQIHR